MANPAELRERNLGLILSEICAGARPGAVAPSRAQIARRTGLHKTTVSQLADELLVSGLITELAPAAPTRSGRPALPLAPSPGRLVGLGMEVNVEYLGLKAVDLGGVTQAERLVAGDWRRTEPEVVLEQLANLGLEVIDSLEANGTEVVGIGLALPGLTTTAGDQQVLLQAPNLGWRELDLRPFRDRLGRPLTLDNEANLAARAEARLAGPDPAERSFVYLSAEVGIGAGLVSDADLIAGLHGWAGEIGHVTVDPSGPACTCGARGCLEVYAGRRAIARALGLPETAGPGEALAALSAGSVGASAGATSEWADGLAGAGSQAAPVFGQGAAKGRDATAGPAPGSLLQPVVDALAVALGGVLNLLDMTQVVLGGDYAVLAPVLAQPLSSALERRSLAARWGGAKVAVRAGRAGPRPAMDGAAWAVLDGVLANPAAQLPAPCARRPAPKLSR
ncbi:MAG: ROK family protein [Bifidobacteriaceae bacterium]|jgi:predicted NBD/HSP70 family sugar kinase|nr:ROK family protein [Bifidobacteriaceae bacterium]